MLTWPRQAHRVENVGAGRWRPAALAGLLVPALVLGPDLQAGEETIVRLAGNDRILWVYRPDPSDASERHRNFAYLRAGQAEDRVFVPLPIPPLRGSAVRHASVGTSLHLFFNDGTHRRYVPIDGRLDVRSIPLQFPERNLPERAVPHALCGDAAQGALYAVVTSTVASKLARESPSQEESVAPRAYEENLGKGDWEGADLSVVRYQDRKWLIDRPVPVDISIETRLEAMVTADGALHLFYHPTSSEGAMLHRYSSDPTDRWSRPEQVPIESDESLLHAGWVEDKVVLLVGGCRAGRTVVRVLELADGHWQPNDVALDIEPQKALCPPHPVIAIIGDRIVSATLDAKEQLRIDIWSRSNGHAITPSPSLSLFNRPWRPRAQATLRFATQYGILGVILVTIFIWRRDSVLRIATPPPDIMLARFGPRLVAFLLDLAILVPLWMPCVFLFWSWASRGLTLTEHFALNTELNFGWIFWTWSAIGAVAGLYGGICEALTGATLGKRVFKLRVVGDDFLRCSLRAVLLRNLLRTVEFQFLPLAILVPLTPSRQRIGDIFARTLVVETRVPPFTDPNPNEFSA